MNENCIDRYISVFLPLYFFYTISSGQIQINAGAKKGNTLKAKELLFIINWNLMMYDVLCMMMQVDAGI